MCVSACVQNTLRLSSSRLKVLNLICVRVCARNACDCVCCVCCYGYVCVQNTHSLSSSVLKVLNIIHVCVCVCARVCVLVSMFMYACAYIIPMASAAVRSKILTAYAFVCVCV